MKTAELASTVERLLADAGLAEQVDVRTHGDDVTVVVTGPPLREALEVLAGAGFDFLVFVTAVDRPEGMTIVYRIGHLGWKAQVAVESEVERDDPQVRTVTDLWPAADWHERETYDLLGVTFEGHPDLRRLLLPEDWVGHPLRKDYRDDSIERRPDYI